MAPLPTPLAHGHVQPRAACMAPVTVLSLPTREESPHDADSFASSTLVYVSWDWQCIATVWSFLRVGCRPRHNHEGKSSS